MSEYLVRAAALQGYRDTVLELGGEPEDILASVGLPTEQMSADDWIPYSAYLRLLETSSSVLDCEHFGLRLSDHQDIDILGAVGCTIQQAPDIRTALGDLSRYFAHHNQGAVVATTVRDGVAHWSFTARSQARMPMRQQSDLAAGIATKVMQILNPRWQPLAIYLPHSAPVDARPYRRRFACPIHFDWDRMIVASDASVLDLPMAQADPRLHRILEGHLNEVERAFSDDFRGKVRYLIHQTLMTGDCSVARVASLLAINKRTLQRRLNAMGCSYQELLDEVRFDIARSYLRDSNGSLTLLADMLGYSELSVFSAAFKQRYGVSPRAWKNQASAG